MEPEQQKDKVLDAVRAHFRPEFINRVDDIIVFHPLTRQDIVRIVDIQLGTLAERLKDRKLTIVVTPEAREYLANKGFDPQYGARPLKRLIQREVQDPLAKRMLSGAIRGGDTVEVDVGDGGLAFRTTTRAPDAA
jgi:ATP-dependent Clp protease ATP-binding subunit ClpB